MYYIIVYVTGFDRLVPFFVPIMQTADNNIPARTSHVVTRRTSHVARQSISQS